MPDAAEFPRATARLPTHNLLQLASGAADDQTDGRSTMRALLRSTTTNRRCYRRHLLRLPCIAILLLSIFVTPSRAQDAATPLPPSMK